MISKEKKEALNREMKRLSIFEDDLIEKFILGSGSGGQKVNKTSSTVYIKHIPTRIEIKCGRQRSRELNRYYARKELCERVASIIHNEQTKKQKEIEKIRQQKRRRSRRQKQKLVEEKRQHSAKKELRKPPSNSSE